MKVLVALFLLAICGGAVRAAEPAAPITALVFAPDGKTLLAASQNGVTSYSWPELKLVERTKASFSHLHDLSFSPSGKKLAIAGGEPQERGGGQLVEWPGGKSSQRIDAGKDVVYQAAWSHDGKTVAMACADKTVRLHDLKSGKTREIADHSAAVLTVLFVPSAAENDAAELLLSAGRDQTIRIFEAATGRPVRALDNHTAPVNDLALRPGHGDELPLVASAGQDKTVRFWQPTIGRLVRFVRLPAPPLAIRWLPSGDFAVAACTDGKIRVIDWQTAGVVLEKKACEGWATALAVSPDGKQAVVGEERGELHAVSLDGIKRE